MSTTWELMKDCLVDAAKAEELVRDTAFRRELKLNPETALASFVLGRRMVPAAAPARASLRVARPVRSQQAA